MEDKHYLGELYKQRFENYSIEVSDSDWDRLASELKWRRFFRFKTFRLNIYYTLLLITLSGLGLFYKIQSDTEKSNPPSETTGEYSQTEKATPLPQIPEQQPEDAKSSGSVFQVKKSLKKNYADSLNLPENVDKDVVVTPSEKDCVMETPKKQITLDQQGEKARQEDSGNALTNTNLKPDSFYTSSSVVNEGAKDSLKKENQQPTQPKKVVHLTQQDTIVVYDTLTIRKKVKVRKRKK